jgi:hypothetical protein
MTLTCGKNNLTSEPKIQGLKRPNPWSGGGGTTILTYQGYVKKWSRKTSPWYILYGGNDSSSGMQYYFW